MEKKMTKKDYFAKVREIVLGSGVAEDDALIVFIDHELELLAKKSASKSKADVEKAVENDRLGSIVLDVLVGQYMTVTDMMKANVELGQLSNQKVSAIVRKLVENGLVVKSTEKGKSYFCLKGQGFGAYAPCP